MNIMSIISSLLRLGVLYLRLKNKKHYTDLLENSQKKQNEIIKEIEKLRDAGDSNSSDRADLLRERLKSERKEIEHISALYTEIIIRRANKDS